MEARIFICLGATPSGVRDLLLAAPRGPPPGEASALLLSHHSRLKPVFSEGEGARRESALPRATLCSNCRDSKAPTPALTRSLQSGPQFKPRSPVITRDVSLDPGPCSPLQAALEHGDTRAAEGQAMGGYLAHVRGRLDPSTARCP